MDKTAVTELHKRLLQNLENDATDMAPNELIIPAAEFTDPDLLARERSRLFLQTPQPVAFSGELPGPGSFLALQVLDTPVLLTRDESGTLRAFINACSHRGAPVASGNGQARSLVCPFHGWAYALDGSVRGRPAEQSFETPTQDCALTPLPVSERFGVVVVAISTTVEQHAVDHALDEIGDELNSLGFGAYRAIGRRQFEVSANWKLVNDLSLESYHFKVLHRDSVAQVLAPNAVVDTMGRHSRWAFPLKSLSRLAALDETAWPDTLEGSCTYTLYPGVMLVVNALGAQMIRAEPGAIPGSSRVTYSGVSNTLSDRDHALQAYEFGGDVFAREDLPMAEQCQRGVAALGHGLPLGKNEPLLQFWHQSWKRALQNHADNRPTVSV